MDKSFSGVARRFFRAYRNGPIRIGHSFIREMLNPIVGKTQEIELRSGLKLNLDMSKGIQNAIFWHDGDIDIHQYWAIRELVPLGGLFIDCGANCGLMGLLARQYRNVKVIFIEPHPRLAQSIATNIYLNRWDSCCELIQAVISDTGGEIVFYEDLKRDGSHAIHPDPGRKNDFRPLGTLPCQTLREIIESRKVDKISFLKIDTERNDHRVLQGIGQYLRPSTIEVAYVEMVRERQLICDLMRSSGYVPFGSKQLKRRSLIKMQQLYERGGSVAFFEPLNESQPFSGDVLWCGKDSSIADHLKRLYQAVGD